MGMFEFRLTPDGGETVDISAGMRDVRIWEKTTKGRSLGMLRDEAGVSATVLYEIAYAAARRQGQLPDGLQLDQFCDTYELDVEDEKARDARRRAEALRDRIVDADEPATEREDDDPETSGLDPTPAAA